MVQAVASGISSILTGQKTLITHAKQYIQLEIYSQLSVQEVVTSKLATFLMYRLWQVLASIVPNIHLSNQRAIHHTARMHYIEQQ